MHLGTKTRRQKLRSKASEIQREADSQRKSKSKREIDRTTGSPSFIQEAPWGQGFCLFSYYCIPNV